MTYRTIQLPKIADPSGNLSVIERDTVPFEIKRVYYLYDIPSGAERGGHSHINLSEFLVAAAGSFDVILKNGSQEITVTLNRPDQGLLIGKGIWRELNNFSAGAVCLVMASDVFDESDYIRDYDTYIDTLK